LTFNIKKAVFGEIFYVNMGEGDTLGWNFDVNIGRAA
jgi:hypothetical protein